MVGKRLAAVLVSLLVLALLLGLPFGDGAQAHSFKGGYSTVVSPTTADAVADLTTVFSIGSPYPNFDKIATAGSGNAFYVASDMELPVGTAVGSISAVTTLSLINGPCNTPVTVNIPFMDATTDIFHTMDWVGDGYNLVYDGDGDTIPNYAEYYPSYLNKMMDPDGSGNLFADPFMPIRPRARYVGHAVLLAGSPPTQLNFLMINPGDLKDMPGAVGGIGDSRGYINVVVLDNPTAGSAPSTQTDFCTGLNTTTVLKGATVGEYSCIGCVAANKPFETVWPSPQCVDAAPPGLGPEDDNDGDGVPNDGCLTIPDPCNGVNDDADATTDEGCGLTRGKNPPANAGIYGGNTHAALTYVQSQYDGPAHVPPLTNPEPAAGDGIENNLDTCPFQVNAGSPRSGGSGDTDYDGLDNVCDPTPGTASTGAPGTCSPPEVIGLPDEDQDCYPNRGDNCPLAFNDQTDTDRDGLGDTCDQNPSTPDGHYHEDNPASAVCVGDTDTDGDGWCDTTEDLLGSAKSGAGAAGKTPEYYGLVYDAVAGPYVCDDYAVYNHPNTNALDNDGDTLINANDDGCQTASGDPVQQIAGGQRIEAKCWPTDAAGARLPGNVDGDGDTVADDRLVYTQVHGNATIRVYCIDDRPADGDYFALRVDNNFVGKCPFDGGRNTFDKTVNGSNNLLTTTWQSVKPANGNTEVYSYTAAPTNSLTCAGFAACGPMAPPTVPFTFASLVPPPPAVDPTVSSIADSDADGLPDLFAGVADNCPNDDNPDQLNTDLYLENQGASVVHDDLGDACDTDDDNDGVSDSDESYLGTDTKDNCTDPILTNTDGNPYDIAIDQSIDVGDILMYKPVILTNVGTVLNDARFDIAVDQSIDVGDILMFKPVILTSCT